MTEEIIIDGVNVAGCEYMLNNKIKGKQHCPAKAMPYAKETSCICRKSIDTPYNFCKHNPNCYYKQLKRLEQENKELREMLSKEPKAMQAFQTAYSGLKKDKEVLWGMVKNYKSALEEINKIAEPRFVNGLNEEADQCNQCMDRIQNKINEVLGDN